MRKVGGAGGFVGIDLDHVQPVGVIVGEHHVKLQATGFIVQRSSGVRLEQRDDLFALARFDLCFDKYGDFTQRAFPDCLS